MFLFFCFEAEHLDKRIAVLEARVMAFDKVADETTRTSHRLDAMEGQVHKFTGALETFLSRIRIDERLRLVPDTSRIENRRSPSLITGPLLPVTRSTSPSTPHLLEIPMDEDDADSAPGVSTSLMADTRTTPPSATQQDVQMGPPATTVSESAQMSAPDSVAPAPVAAPPPVPVTPAPVAAPTPINHARLPAVNLIPPTPQGSQLAPTASVAPPTTTAEVPPPPRQVPRGRSRTAATDTSLLGIQGGAITRSRSRSKTPI